MHQTFSIIRNSSLHNWKRYERHEWDMNEKKFSLKNEKNQTKTRNKTHSKTKTPNNLLHFPIAFLMDFCGIINTVYTICRAPRNKLLGEKKLFEEDFRKIKRQQAVKHLGKTRTFVPHLLPAAATPIHCSSTACNSLSLWEHSSKGPSSTD